MDPQLLLDLGSSVWKGISSQIVYEYLTVPADDILFGSVQHIENRLQVKLLSTVLMAVTLGALCGTAIVIMMSRFHDVAPCDPSPTPRSLPRTRLSWRRYLILRSATLGQMQDTFKRYTLRSKLTGRSLETFHLEVVPRVSSEESTIPSKEHTKDDCRSWFMPMATKHWFLCVAILLSVLLIATLEVLQNISEARQGFVPVNPGDNMSSQILSQYLPAVTMLVVGTLFTSIRDTAAIFAPYSRLKRGNAPISTMEHNLIGMTTLRALLSARTLSIGYFVSLLACLVVPFLTIVVSGLYTAVLVYTSLNTTLILTDRFNFTEDELSLSDNNAAAITNLIEWSNLSFPAWTYHDLAFNKAIPQGPLPDTGLMLVEIPAYRAKLDCDIPTYEEYSFGTAGAPPDDVGGQVINMTEIDLGKSLRMPCLHSADSANVTWSQSLYVPHIRPLSYIGQASVLQWSRPPMSNNSQSLVIAQGSGGIFSGEDGAPAFDISVGGYSCPSFGLTLGSVNITNAMMTEDQPAEIITDFTFVMCFQRLERVQTRVALNLPDLTINTTVPPQTDESSAVAVNNSALLDGVWEWPINNMLLSLLNGESSSTSYDLAIPGGDPTYGNNLDPFLNTIVAGRFGIPISELLGTSDRALGFLTNASKMLYSEYMAQAISANMRSTTSLTGTPYPAQILDIPGWRLQQNRDSKIALQAMLGFLALAAIIMYLSLETRRVLPHNPCSMAGAATLLIDSELLTRDLMPVGAEWLSTEQLQRLHIFQGLRFYLGWKKDPEGVQHEDTMFGIYLES
ncbi:hypothetical protein E4T44_00894 [Aureobasidium sp. EXF-8845]|nr:hypothetical protein E4T44_00894 [Aureobasidium sp. EXF-8845]KAI4857659.1 hypothetical protein E4T45_00845 [Aureobasidium sp. EXF-8846]